MDDSTAACAPRLAVRLLGRLEVEALGRPVRLGGRHAQALMALLALRPRPRLRDAIAADLWPESQGPSASSLRQALWLVRTGLSAAGIDPDDVLEVEQDTLGLRRCERIDLDVARFEELLAGGPTRTDEALALYQGDLADGLGHECFAAERERLSDLYEDGLTRAAVARLEAGDVDRARTAAMLVLSRDPLREEAHGVLIAAYGIDGSRSQVVRQYRRVEAILHAELGVAPLPETEAAYRTALALTVRRSEARIAGPGRERTVLRRILAPSA